MVIIILIKEPFLSCPFLFLSTNSYIVFPLRIFRVYQYAFHKSTWQAAKRIRAVTFLNYLNSQTLNF